MRWAETYVQRNLYHHLPDPYVRKAQGLAKRNALAQRWWAICWRNTWPTSRSMRTTQYFFVFSMTQYNTSTLRSLFNRKILQGCHVYDEGTLNDVIIESVDASMRHSLRGYWASNPQTDSANFAYLAESLLFYPKWFREYSNKQLPEHQTTKP